MVSECEQRQKEKRLKTESQDQVLPTGWCRLHSFLCTLCPPSSLHLTSHSAFPLLPPPPLPSSHSAHRGNWSDLAAFKVIIQNSGLLPLWMGKVAPAIRLEKFNSLLA